MSQKEFANFFKIPNFFAKTVGVIINDNEVLGKWEKFLINLVFYLGFINLNVCVFGEVVFVQLSLKDHNMVDAVMTLSYIGFVYTAIFKLLYILRKKRELQRYLNKLLEIFPKTEKQMEIYKMKRYLQNCTKITVACSGLFMLFIWTYNLYPLVKYLVCDKWFHWLDIGQQLPYTVYIPWDWQRHGTFYLVYAAECWAGYDSAAIQVVCDFLLCSTATQLIMHYDFLAQRMENYEVFVAKNDSSYEKSKASERNLWFLKNFVIYHNVVLGLSDQMNSLFGIPLLFNFMVSSFVICFVGFQMTIGASTEVLIKLCMFLATSMSQVFLICYYGEKLKNSSENIALAIFQHDWHDADLRYKKMLVLIAERAQKPAMIQATSLLIVSQATMTDILQLSYKFFALLRTLYG